MEVREVKRSFFKLKTVAPTKLEPNPFYYFKFDTQGTHPNQSRPDLLFIFSFLKNFIKNQQ
jgi:hypothetical protein